MKKIMSSLFFAITLTLSLALISGCSNMGHHGSHHGDKCEGKSCARSDKKCHKGDKCARKDDCRKCVKGADGKIKCPRGADCKGYPDCKECMEKCGYKCKDGKCEKACDEKNCDKPECKDGKCKTKK